MYVYKHKYTYDMPCAIFLVRPSRFPNPFREGGVDPYLVFRGLGLDWSHLDRACPKCTAHLKH